MDRHHIGRCIFNAKNGDTEGFEFVFKHYYDKILNYIIRYSSSKGRMISKEDAKDICSDVFYEIWSHFDKFKIEDEE